MVPYLMQLHEGRYQILLRKTYLNNSVCVQTCMTTLIWIWPCMDNTLDMLKCTFDIPIHKLGLDIKKKV
eukprot:c35145_g1_i1 orf=99-305(+)